MTHKTKEQRRKEAKIRERSQFESRRLFALSHQMNGDAWNESSRNGSTFEDRAINARKVWVAFKRWCESVGVDEYGNVYEQF